MPIGELAWAAAGRLLGLLLDQGDDAFGQVCGVLGTPEPGDLGQEAEQPVNEGRWKGRAQDALGLDRRLRQPGLSAATVITHDQQGVPEDRSWASPSPGAAN